MPSYTVGPLCRWVETNSAVYTRESCNTLEAYTNTLITAGSCELEQPGRLVWTPNENTPGIVYYQVCMITYCDSLITLCLPNSLLLITMLDGRSLLKIEQRLVQTVAA